MILTPKRLNGSKLRPTPNLHLQNSEDISADLLVKTQNITHLHASVHVRDSPVLFSVGTEFRCNGAA